MPSFKTGEDPAFFKQLSDDLGAGVLGPLNRKRAGFHGWSGGAQVRNRVFLRHFILKICILPRQARTNIGRTQERRVFLQMVSNIVNVW